MPNLDPGEVTEWTVVHNPAVVWIGHWAAVCACGWSQGEDDLNAAVEQHRQDVSHVHTVWLKGTELKSGRYSFRVCCADCGDVCTAVDFNVATERWREHELTSASPVGPTGMGPVQ